MKLRSARQAIHDAYALHLTSKGFDFDFRERAKKPDFSGFLQKAYQRSEKDRERMLSGFAPVGFYSEDRSQRQDNNAQVRNAVEAGMIIAAVERLPEPFCSWAKWAYGPRTEDFLPEQGAFFRWLDQDVEDNFASITRVYRKATRGKIRDVVVYAVLDYRSVVVNGRSLYPESLVIKKCQIHRGNWKRDFEAWHGYYWRLCDSYLDSVALPPVARVVHRLNHGAEKFMEK